MRIARFLSLCLLVAATVALMPARDAFAGPGDDLLKKVEDASSPAKDSTGNMEMVLIESNGKEKKRKLKMMQMQHKPSDYRLLRFLSPAEVKGVAFLSKSDTEMYLYMPAFKKIRRIASSAKNENFMGTDFSYDDIGNTSYTDDYTAKIVSKDKDVTVLELTPKHPGENDYSKLVMTVDNTNYIPREIKFFNKAQKLWKVMTNDKVEKISGYWTPTAITMKDLKKNHATKMYMKDIKFDVGLGKRDFSKRKLKRSH
ncbi:MAG: outer membrane lipoprotein-sorting protein [Deltaproteobacteria bacterium]|nr:outer membrane lipoprotein-sorting protein [Deltaproteobacteria bacterium]